MAYEKDDRKKKQFRDRRKDSDRPSAPDGDRRRSGERRQQGDRKFRQGDRREGRPPRGDREKGRDRDSKPRMRRDAPRRDAPRREAPRREAEQERPQEARRLLLPQEASRLLYRGIDCQVNGDTNTAMIMFIHGSVKMSEGCENNADRILKEIGKDRFTAMRTEIGPQCSEDALTEFDYLCIRRSKSYDRTFFDNEYSKSTTHAIFRKICLEEVEGDDPIIDVFASRYPDESEKVVKGLDLLKRKKDSASAEAHLARIEEAVKLKQSVNVMFTRAMNGDARAVRELKDLSNKVPEAAFFSEYLTARAEGRNVEWLKAKYPQYKDLIISKQGEFKIQDDPFGMFLKAKNLEMKKEEWMSVMMNAARAGSQEAIDELSGKMFRNDVRKCLAGIYLKNNDLPNLMTVYQAGLDDMYYLDQYCGSDEDRILEVGRELGKQGISKEIDWLKDHYDKGMDFCREALIEKSGDEAYQCKKMIYTLHDIGSDMDAAKLYFAMEGNPETPSVKWLKKVCTDEEVKEYVRKHYSDIGQDEVFDSIFEEDGYESRPKRQSKGRGSFGRSGQDRRRSGRRRRHRHLHSSFFAEKSTEKDVFMQ